MSATTDQKVPSSGGPRVPLRYTDAKKTVSDVIASKQIIRGDLTGVLDPDGGQNRISYILPNDTGRWLDCSSLELTGQIWVNATNTAGDGFGEIRPEVKYVYEILDNFKFLVASKKLEEQLDCDVNHTHIDLEKNSVNLPEFETYQTAPFTLGDTAASWKDFRIRLQYSSSELLGPSVDMDDANNVVLPVWLLGQARLEIYFRPSNRVVSVNADAVQTGMTSNYQIRNVYLDSTWITSPSKTASITRNPDGFNVTWQAHQYAQYTIPATAASTKVSTNLPSSFQNVSDVLVLYQNATQFTDLTEPERNHEAGSEVGKLVTMNTRVNSRLRYMEDLKASDVYRELLKSYPKAQFADWVNEPTADFPYQVKPGLAAGTAALTTATGALAGAAGTTWLTDFNVGDLIQIDGVAGLGLVAPIVNITSDVLMYINIGQSSANIVATVNWTRIRFDAIPSTITPILYNTSHSIWSFLVARDYADPLYMSGYSTSNATGSIVSEFAMETATTSNYVFRSWMRYARNLHIWPNGRIEITS